MPTDIRLMDAEVLVEGGKLRVTQGGIESAGAISLPVPTNKRGILPGSYLTEQTDLGAEIKRLRNEIDSIREQMEALQVFATIKAEATHYTQEGWRYCGKCSNLTFAPNNARSVCAKDKLPHDVTSSAYVLFPHRSRYAGQNGWRWCRKCQGLGHEGAPASAHCPAGGMHDRSASPDYILWADNYPAKDFNAQPEWRYCNLCTGLCHGSSGVCPAPAAAGGTHNYGGSANYHIMW